MQKILIRQPDAIFQLRLISPSQLCRLGYIQQLARRSVRLGDIPQDFPLIAHHLGYQLRQLPDAEFLAIVYGRLSIYRLHCGQLVVICMPDGAPIMKVENTKRLGAQVELVPGAYDEAHDRAVQLQEETGMTFIHPYDDELVIAGQGSIGLEILDQLPDVEAVIVPIGGGGLISGVAFAIKSLRPEVKVYGVQAAGAASMYKAFHDHKYETLDHVSTFADGIAVKTPGENTYELISKYVDDIVTVSEDEIATAILTLIEKQKLIAEGAGATPVAAALFDKLPIKGKKTVCVVSGGNIDVNILSRVITRGQVTSGRRADLVIALQDRPGQLREVSEIVSSCGANVVGVQHNRSDADMDITGCFLRLELETRDAEQINEIRAKLTKAGFTLIDKNAAHY